MFFCSESCHLPFDAKKADCTVVNNIITCSKLITILTWINMGGKNTENFFLFECLTSVLGELYSLAPHNLLKYKQHWAHAKIWLHKTNARALDLYIVFSGLQYTLWLNPYAKKDDLWISVSLRYISKPIAQTQLNYSHAFRPFHATRTLATRSIFLTIVYVYSDTTQHSYFNAIREKANG